LTKLRGISDLITFLNFLDKHNIFYRIEHHRDDTVLVTFTLVGSRVEVDFFEDHIEFSYFTGSEDVEENQELLFNMISKTVNG